MRTLFLTIFTVVFPMIITLMFSWFYSIMNGSPMIDATRFLAGQPFYWICFMFLGFPIGIGVGCETWPAYTNSVVEVKGPETPIVWRDVKP